LTFLPLSGKLATRVPVDGGGIKFSSDARPAEMSEKRKRAISPLAEVEMETLEEGREWTRKRLEKRLQRLADGQGAIPPPRRSAVAEGVEDRADGGDGRR